MSGLSEEEIDAKFNALFPEEDFQYVAPSESTTQSIASKPKATVEIGSPTNVSPELVGGVAGLSGMALGRPYQRIANAISTPVSASGTPDIPKKPYTNAWGTKTGYGIGEGTTRQQSEAYKDINPNKKLDHGNIRRRWNVDTMLEEMAKREALASEGVKGNKAKYLEYLGQKLGLVSNAVPRLATGLGAFGAGYEGAEAYNRARQGDYPGAAISAIGALGSGASLIPHPATKAVGTGLALASPLALGAYDKYINPPK